MSKYAYILIKYIFANDVINENSKGRYNLECVALKIKNLF